MDTNVERYLAVGGYRRQCENAGINYSRDTIAMIDQAQAIGTYKAWRALRATFRAWYWITRDERYLQLSSLCENKAKAILFEAI